MLSPHNGANHKCLYELPHVRYTNIPHSLIGIADLLTISNSICDTRVDYIPLISNSYMEGIGGVHPGS